MVKELTNKKFWSEYWMKKNKIDCSIIPETFLFHDVLNEYVPKTKKIKFLEIGGYPGQWAIFFAKYWRADSTLLDRYVDMKVIKSLSKVNDVENINVIEGDVFDLAVETKFDVVMSAGFIEHFSDVNSVVDRHVQFLKPNGTLVLTVPNLLGLNGLLQKTFDKKNYEIHYLETMCEQNLEKIIKSQNLEIVYIGYYGKFGLWLEDIMNKPKWLRLLVRLSDKLGRILVRFNSKIFSPHLVVIARNKNI